MTDRPGSMHEEIKLSYLSIILKWREARVQQVEFWIQSIVYYWFLFFFPSP